MKKYLLTVIALMTTLAFVSPLYAAGEMEKASGEKQQVGSMQGQSARELLGMGITSQNGEELGSIQDIKFDTETGRVKYVTITKGGVLGVGGEKGIPVPLEAFQFSDKGATLTVDKGKLDNAPQPSGIADESFQQKLESHYGVSPAWQPESSQPMEMQKEQMKKPEMEKEHKSSPY